MKLSLNPGETKQLYATGVRDSGLDALPPDQVAWSSSDPAVTVDASGLVTAVAPGSAVVSVQWREFSDTVTIRVDAPPVPPTPPTGVKIIA